MFTKPSLLMILCCLFLGMGMLSHTIYNAGYAESIYFHFDSSLYLPLVLNPSDGLISTPTLTPAPSMTAEASNTPLLSTPTPTGGASMTPTPTSSPTQMAEAADLVLRNGSIYTVNDAQPWGEAVAVKEGNIVFVGSNQGVEAFIGSQTQVTDLDGKLMLPGFHDVHAHPLEADSPIITCLLPSDTDPEEMITLIQECAPDQVGTNWVLGSGYSITELLETKRLPIEILDEAVPDRPAIMMGETSHSVWVNSMALVQAGIDANSPNPIGGIIMKDPESGEPTGILLENAGNILMDLALAPTAELEELHYEGLLSALSELAHNGITSVSDARAYTSRNYPEVWLRAEQEGTLTARTILGLWAYPHYEDTEQLATLTALYSNDPERLLRMSQIKLYSDGLLENTTAALLEPYLLDLGILPGNLGMNYFSQERLAQYITTLEQVGFDFHIHTLGDRGVREALNAIESAIETNGTGIERRHRLTHLELIDEADRSRFASLGVIADFQVAGSWTLPKHWGDHEPLIGERAFDPIPVRSIYDTGAIVTLSSDWDVSPLSPFEGIENSLNRAQQSLPTVESAVRAYTLNGAIVMRQENRVGSIEVGKLADLIVVDQNIFTVPQAQISDTKVLLTLLGGEEIYRDPSFPLTTLSE